MLIGWNGNQKRCILMILGSRTLQDYDRKEMMLEKGI